MAKPTRKAGSANRQGEEAGLTREYHIVPEGPRWNVERDDIFTGQFAFAVDMAIGQAVAAAKRDQHNGFDVMVCVQKADGTCRKVWP